MQDRNSKDSQIVLAAKILSRYPDNGKIRTGNLRKDIRHFAGIIQGVYRNARSTEKNGAPLSKAYEWIADNYYYVEETIKSIIVSLKKHKYFTAALSEENIIVPKYYAAFRDYVKECTSAQDAKTIDAFVRASDKNPDARPEFSDFYSFELLFSCAVISCLAEACQFLEASSSESKADYALEFSKYILSLRYVREHCYEKSFESCETEEYLRKDPAGFYSSMTKETKNFYRTRISLLSEQRGLSEKELAAEILEKARRAKDSYFRHIGAYLCPGVSKTRGILYFTLLFLITLSVTVFLCTVSPYALILAFPVWELSKQICDRLFAAFLIPSPIPSLDLKTIPDTDGVLTVITALLDGKNDTELFDRLENIYHSSGMKNLYFAILGDFPDTSDYKYAECEKIFSYAHDRIKALNEKYHGCFFLFVRKPEFSLSEQRFMGKERKRGAVAELTSFLCEKDPDCFMQCEALPDADTCKRIRFVLTLDSDTSIPPDAVRKMTGIMLHPLNKAQIDTKNGLVTKGYGIIQPAVGTSLDASTKTRFTSVMCGAGGLEIYAFAGFELYQSVFGEGNFCGKGMFDKYAYDCCINSKKYSFPEEKVLSHDIIEGTRLRCAMVSEIKFTDGFPKNSFSYLKRHHRWVRGDTQNLMFLKSTLLSRNSDTIINNISPLSKFKLFDNFRRAATSIFAFLGLAAASFFSIKPAICFTVFSLLYLLFPFLSDIAGMISTLGFQCAARRFFSKEFSNGIAMSFLRVFVTVSMLPANALSTLDAILRSAYRMCISKRKTLEWTTAAAGDATSNSSLSACISKNMPGTVIGAGMFIFSPYSVLKIIGLLWFLFPITAYRMGKAPKRHNNDISLLQNSIITEYAEDIWKFFIETVTPGDNHLPIDNIQFFAEEKKAHKTSPTNIGLYLLSTLAARDFGFIGTNELYERLHNSFEAIEKADKWHGHLYNWYSTEDLSVLNPKCISSVDSGNFLACLIALKEGLKEYANENTGLLDLITETEKLINQTDISKLYNKDKNLFILEVTIDPGGMNGGEKYSNNCFDMLMSEARTLSYIAVAKRAVPTEHWAALSRPLIKHSHRIGVASWTGTAFEYLMPSLFLPNIRGSLMYEAQRFAFFRQRARTAMSKSGAIWGISESGYCAFDENMNYQYLAFGIPELAYKRGLESQLVISPYSSFLSLAINTELPLKNLERIKSAGAYGKYGFYESYDFTPSRCIENGTVVYSNMSHHQGMSLIASANCCFGNIFVNRFMRDKQMNSAKELLEEKIPVNAVVGKMKRITSPPERTNRQKYG